MKTFNYFLLSVGLILFLCVTSNAHISFNINGLGDCEKSLQELFLRLYDGEDDSQKENANKEILQTFRAILKENASFSYPFDSLKQVGKIHSTDSVLRIYTWMLPLKKGYKHFGFVQYRSKIGELILFELDDKSYDFNNAEQQILNEKKWYGAVYYKILPIYNKKEKVYTLFGFDANNMLSNKKIVEIISIDSKDNLIFGKKVFKTKKGFQNRLIFEYSKRSVMMLKYDERYQMIVHDHLSPEKPFYKGQFMFYVPDLSYDGWMFEKGIWNMVEDIDLRNPKKR